MSPELERLADIVQQFEAMSDGEQRRTLAYLCDRYLGVKWLWKFRSEARAGQAQEGEDHR